MSWPKLTPHEESIKADIIRMASVYWTVPQEQFEVRFTDGYNNGSELHALRQEEYPQRLVRFDFDKDEFPTMRKALDGLRETVYQHIRGGVARGLAALFHLSPEATMEVTAEDGETVLKVKL